MTRSDIILKLGIGISDTQTKYYEYANESIISLLHFFQNL
jgi:hypothetical protein